MIGAAQSMHSRLVFARNKAQIEDVADYLPAQKARYVKASSSPMLTLILKPRSRLLGHSTTLA